MMVKYLDNPEFSDAIYNGDVNTVRSMIESGEVDMSWQSDVEKWNHLTVNLLDPRARISPDVVRVMVENGLDLYQSDIYDRTALHMATHNGDTDLVEYIVNQGVKIDTPDENNLTPLAIALGRGEINVRIVELLLQSGADPEYLSKGATRTCREIAAFVQDEYPDLKSLFGL